MCTDGPPSLATLNKYNALIQEKPPDPSWNKEIFLRFF